MSFIWPWMLAALALLPVGIAAYILIGRRRRRRLGALAGPRLAAPRPSLARRLRTAIPAALTLGALALIVVSLARPEAVISVPRLEGTLILSIDVSASMAADDVEPSRLDVAKGIARELVAQRPDGVVMGIVAFGDSGLAVQVPTRDATTLERAIDRLAPTFGTSLGEGILAVLDSIARLDVGTPADTYSSLEAQPSLAPTPLEPGSRSATAIVLLSDGENMAPPEPAEAARAAAERGIRIHSVPLGTVAGSTLDLDGFSVHTRLDESLLRHIAEVTAGEYLPLDPEAEVPADAVAVEAIYGSLGSDLVAREEHLEVTSLVAGSGVALLVAAAVLSLLLSGRLP
jgi:Ca-activated chloride channel family protein